MPVEIRELQITTTVQDNGSTSSSTSASPSNNEDIIAKCVEQVLEILKEKSER
ncbi:MAG: DUF5908 family protein [Mucilaginibacter sp.]